jgi:TPR repeat protein
VVKRAIAAQQDRQLKSVEVRIEDVLHDLREIAHTDLQTLTEQSGVPARWGDKLQALELLMKHLGLAAPETHQHVHQHVHFTPEQFNRMSDDQLDRSEAAYKALAQYNLGNFYAAGRGVPQDYVLAYKWFNLAASRSSGQVRERAIADRDSVYELLTRDQIAEAQRLAREWDEAHPRD